MTPSRGAEQRFRQFAAVIAALFAAHGCGRSTSHEQESSGSGGDAGVENGGSSGVVTGGLGGANPSGGRGQTGGASAGGTAGAGGRGGSSAGTAGAGGVDKRNGERCVANAECLSGYCYSDAPDAGSLPPRTCRDCLPESAYSLWCDEDADCCQGLICGSGERAGVCITP